jgi:hypothetical protein
MQQRFDATNDISYGVDLSLISQFELSTPEGQAQVRLKTAPRAHFGVHFWLEETQGTATVALGTVHRQIGAAQQACGVSSFGEFRCLIGCLSDQTLFTDVCSR